MADPAVADPGPAHGAAWRAERTGGSGRAPGRNDGAWTRLWIGAGRETGVRPGDLVGSITNEAGVPARAIGAIQISGRFSIVEVAEGAADDDRPGDARRPRCAASPSRSGATGSPPRRSSAAREDLRPASDPPRRFGPAAPSSQGPSSGVPLRRRHPPSNEGLDVASPIRILGRGIASIAILASLAACAAPALTAGPSTTAVTRPTSSTADPRPVPTAAAPSQRRARRRDERGVPATDPALSVAGRSLVVPDVLVGRTTGTDPAVIAARGSTTFVTCTSTSTTDLAVEPSLPILTATAGEHLVLRIADGWSILRVEGFDAPAVGDGGNIQAPIDTPEGRPWVEVVVPHRAGDARVSWTVYVARVDGRAVGMVGASILVHLVPAGG